MTDLETFTAMLTRARIRFDRLDIHGGLEAGDVEISYRRDDMLTMRRCRPNFRFGADGALKWVDADVPQ